MCKRAKRWVTALALAVAFSFALAGVAGAAEGPDQKALELFEQGVTAYETGEYEKAGQVFDQLLARQPGMPTALGMRERAELGQFIEMREQPELREQATRILDLMTRAVREQRKGVEKPAQLLKDFQSEQLTVYGKARVKLRSHGPYAVPHLLKLLAADAEVPENLNRQTVVARTVSLLADMHPDAVLPLSEALVQTPDDAMKTRLADVLGSLDDRRAVPALMAVWEAPKKLETTRKAAAEALHSITGQGPAQMGSAAASYLELGLAYLNEKKEEVGYGYGVSSNVWQWNPDAEEWAQKLTYTEVPNYSYHQRMATETALAGLATAPEHLGLRSLLAAGLVRRLALAEMYRDGKVAGREVSDELAEDAEQRAETLGSKVAVALRVLTAPVAARALTLTLEAGGGPSSLYLVKSLDAKMQDAAGQEMDAQAVSSLTSALNSGDKDVRYNAAIAFVRACPAGGCGPDEQIVDVMHAAVMAAARRTALIAVRDFQTVNTLTPILRDAGVATVQTSPNGRAVARSLEMVPSVDIVFVSANADQTLFDNLMEVVTQDARTKAAPLYAIVDPGRDSADLTDYDRIDKVFNPGDLREKVLKPLLQEKVLAESRSAFTEEEAERVLKAVEALQGVDPLTTSYPYKKLEPALLEALKGYGDEVTTAVADALKKFGSAGSLAPLADLVEGEWSTEIKVAACSGIAAVLKRSGEAAPQKVIAALKQAWGSDEAALKEAAAEALGVAGLKPAEQMSMVRQALGR